jgi:hypothetical protein
MDQARENPEITAAWEAGKKATNSLAQGRPDPTLPPHQKEEDSEETEGWEKGKKNPKKKPL